MSAKFIGQPRPDQIGQRFAITEARIAELEETINVMRDLLTKNNDSLAEILRAIAGEKPQ